MYILKNKIVRSILILSFSISPTAIIASPARLSSEQLEAYLVDGDFSPVLSKSDNTCVTAGDARFLSIDLPAPSCPDHKMRREELHESKMDALTNNVEPETSNVTESYQTLLGQEKLAFSVLIHFTPGSSKLDEEAQNSLRKLTETLDKKDILVDVVIITGHADKVRPPFSQEDMSLSEERANAVREFLKPTISDEFMYSEGVAIEDETDLNDNDKSSENSMLMGVNPYVVEVEIIGSLMPDTSS